MLLNVSVLNTLNIFTDIYNHTCTTKMFYSSRDRIFLNISHYLPTGHLAPWMIGMILGYVLYRYRNTIRISKVAYSSPMYNAKIKRGDGARWRIGTTSDSES